MKVCGKQKNLFWSKNIMKSTHFFPKKFAICILQGQGLAGTTPRWDACTLHSQGTWFGTHLCSPLRRQVQEAGSLPPTGERPRRVPGSRLHFGSSCWAFGRDPADGSAVSYLHTCVYGGRGESVGEGVWDAEAHPQQRSLSLSPGWSHDPSFLLRCTLEGS